MANTSIYAAFERMWQHIVSTMNNKSEINHLHDDRYYEKSEVDIAINDTKEYIDELIGDLLNGAS